MWPQFTAYRELYYLDIYLSKNKVRRDNFPFNISSDPRSSYVVGTKVKTVSENLKMNSALLSRFDLVFILLDKPDEEIDCILSENVMALHSDGP